MSRVVFDNVTKRFGDVVAVEQLNLHIDNEEFMVLLGPSGCGKTTALRLIAGLDAVSDGTMCIGDRVVNDIEAKDRNVSMVFQSYALYPHMTVARNIESPLVARKFAVDGLEPRKLTSAERKTRVTEAAETLGLSELLDRKPAALSGGQRQRVALARAIVSRPAAFLFDEPLSNLDAMLRAQTRVELVELHKDLHTTFVYVTHDQIEAMTMATRIAIIDQGRLQQVGPPQDVYECPFNLFVARFIGSPPMNTMAATVEAHDGETVASLPSAGRLPLGPIDLPVRDGAPVVVGVRPEHFIRGDGPLRAPVTMVEWLGHERHIMCDLDGTTVTLREPAEGPAPKKGEELHLGASPENLHLFDPDTTERLG